LIRLALIALAAALATAAGAGVIEGRVVDERGEPVEGASLWLEDTGPSHLNPVIATAITDPSGNFRFEGVPEGDLMLRCSAEGYASQVMEEITAEQGWVILELSPEIFAVVGRVVDTEDQPVAGVRVERGVASLRQTRDGERRRRTEFTAAETNSAGEFILMPLDQEGPVRLDVYPFAEGRDGPQLLVELQSREISEPLSDSEVIVIPPTQPLTVQVVDQEGQGIEGVNVYATPRLTPSSPFRGVQDRLTDEDGTAEFSHLWTGGYTVNCRRGGMSRTRQLMIAEDAAPPRLILPLSGPGRISGRVVSQSGEPETDVHINVTEIQRSALDPAEESWSGICYITTDDHGRFEVSDLPWGEYLLRVSVAAETARRRGADRVRVTLSEEQPQVTLQEPLSADRDDPSQRVVQGVVLDATGHPVSGTWVLPLQHGITHMFVGGFTPEVFAEERGMLERSCGLVESDEMGEFTLTLHPLEIRQAIFAYHPDGLCGLSRLPEPHDWREPPRVSVTLTESTTLRGKVLHHRDHSPVVGQYVGMLLPPTGELSLPPLVRDPSFHTLSTHHYAWATRTELGGTFEFGPLPSDLVFQLDVFNPNFTQCQVVGPHTVPASGEMTILWQPTELLDIP
jgi:Carboxypeptidase regulatory-like domain